MTVDVDVAFEMDRRDKAAAMRQARKDAGREYISDMVIEHFRNGLNAPPVKKIPIAKPKISKPGEEQVHALWSDLHHCREVRGTINEAITEGALMKYCDTLIELVNRQRKHCKVEVLNLYIAGDNLHGVANFESQARETSGNASYQIYSLSQLLIKAIQKLRPHFKLIKIVAMGGNHGRRNRGDNVLDDNLEIDALRIVQAAFMFSSDIRFHVEAHKFYYVNDALGQKFLITHGDIIKGTSAQSTLRAMNAYSQNLPESFDHALMGHQHRIQMLPLISREGSNKSRFVFVNGTASRGDSYISGFGGNPSLCWWAFFSNAKRITSQFPVDLYE